MDILFKKIVAALLAPLFGLASWSGALPVQEKSLQVNPAEVQSRVETQFGAYNPSGGGTYKLKASVGLTDTSINLSSFKEPVSATPYNMTYLNTTVAYGTLDPQTTRSEFVSFTGITQNADGSAQLTGVTRGLTRTPRGSACTASSTLAQRHPGQAGFILSDSPCHFAEYSVKKNDEAITGIWNFNSYLPTSNITPTTTEQLVNKGYTDGLAFNGAGVIDATEGAKGVSELATQLEQASSTPSGSSGPLVLQAKNATSTRLTTGTGRYLTVTDADGYLNNTFLDLTRYQRQASTTNISVSENMYVTGSSTLSGSVLLTPSSVIDSTGKQVLWTLLASTTNPSTAALTISNLPARALLRVYIYSNGNSGNLAIRFNGDSAINYTYTYASSTLGYAAGQSSIILTNNSGAFTSVIDIFNPLSTTKIVNANTTYAQGTSFGTTTPSLTYDLSAVWATTTPQQITSITIGAGGSVVAGTQVYVYGSAF